MYLEVVILDKCYYFLRSHFQQKICSVNGLRFYFYNLPPKTCCFIQDLTPEDTLC